MIPFQNMDRVIEAMKECLPKGDKFRIEGSSIVDGYQHYVGDIIRLTLKYEEDGTQNTKFLVLKVPKNGDSASAFFKLEFTAREPFVYDEVIPRIHEHLDESLAPFYYKTIDSKVIILEDLVELGYEAGENNRQPYALDQCFPVLKALAHFHATTHKLCQEKPHLAEHKMFNYSSILEFRQCVSAFFETTLVRLLATSNASSLIPKLKNAIFHLRKETDEISSKTRCSNFDFYVLNHGDFRRDNVLLKYASDAVVGVKILDFQTCFWSTPVYDFMYFFMLSVRVEIMEHHFDELSNWYLRCLNEKLDEVNCSRVYRKQDFMADIEKLNLCFVYFVAVNALMLFPLDRNKLLDRIIRGEKDDENDVKVCLEDELFTSSALNGLKLCDRLGVFEPYAPRGYGFKISTRVEIMKHHFDELSTWYLRCLNEKLDEVNCSPVYQKQDFMADIKKLNLCFVYFVTVNAVMLYPLDRNKLLDRIIRGEKDNENDVKACLEDELFTSSALNGLKLCDRLRLFERV